MTRKRTCPHILALAASIFAFPLGIWAFQESETPSDPETLKKVAEAIMKLDDKASPGDLFKTVKEANPGKEAIVSLRELNKAFADEKISGEISGKRDAILEKQGAAQKAVREEALSIRQRIISEYCAKNKEKSRTLWGIGDIGSWATAEKPDASMDIDWSVLGADPDVTAEVRDIYQKELLKSLIGEGAMSLKDFDIVVTAQGHEVEAHVFETEGGIDWAMRNMKMVTLVSPNGKLSRRIELASKVTKYGPDGKAVLGTDGKPLKVEMLSGDPVGEMAMAEQLAHFRRVASEQGHYDYFFDANGNFHQQILIQEEGKPNAIINLVPEEILRKYDKYMDGFGIDYYRSRTETSAGGCLDMAKHLNEEVLTKTHEAKAKLKKTLKYVSRANNISRGVPGLEKIMASDMILGDPENRAVIELARKVATADPVEVNRIVRDLYGDKPDAGLQELGAKARKIILRQAEVSYQYELDRIILEVKTPEARKTALEKLSKDMSIIAEQKGEYSDLAKGAAESIIKLLAANEKGSIDKLRENWKSLDSIRKAEQGAITRVKEYFEQSELGRTLKEVSGLVLEIGRTPIYESSGPVMKSDAAEFLGSVVESVRGEGAKAMDLLGSISMWAEVIDSVKNARSDAELAVALGKTLVTNTFLGVVLSSYYAGVVQGDNEALAKAIMYMLIPEAALPALVESLGATVINMGAQSLFDAQLEAQYALSRFDKENKLIDIAGTGSGGEEGAVALINDLLMPGGYKLAEDMVDAANKRRTEMGSGLDALMKTGVVRAIDSTLTNGNPLIFKDDAALMAACDGVRKYTEEIGYLAKAWGVTVPNEAPPGGDWSAKLSKGETRAIDKLIEQRDRCRAEAKKILAAAIVRTFEDRRRAEAALDSGEAKEQYDKLVKIFEDLQISKEGMAALEAEGAPGNILKGIFEKIFGGATMREKYVTATKAVQRFLDAYSLVLQIRTSTEESSKKHLGGLPTPRPLTGSLPLTGKPEIDVSLARAYAGEASKIAENCVRDLELAKKDKLEGDYDLAAFRKLFEMRQSLAYWNMMWEAAREAQSLHWAVEVFDKASLRGQTQDANQKVKDLQSQDALFLEEFQQHYAIDGDFILSLKGPEEIRAGEPAAIKCEVIFRPKPKAGETAATEPQAVPEEIARQLRFAWSSGKAKLGEDARVERTYRLSTPGVHEFTVALRRVTVQAGKKQVVNLGEKTWSVTVEGGQKPVVEVSGSGNAELGQPIELFAGVKDGGSSVKDLRFDYRILGQGSLGGGEKQEFNPQAPGNYTLELRAFSRQGDREIQVGEARHEIAVREPEPENASRPRPSKGPLPVRITASPAELVAGDTMTLSARAPAGLKGKIGYSSWSDLGPSPRQKYENADQITVPICASGRLGSPMKLTPRFQAWDKDRRNLLAEGSGEVSLRPALIDAGAGGKWKKSSAPGADVSLKREEVEMSQPCPTKCVNSSGNVIVGRAAVNASARAYWEDSGFKSLDELQSALQNENETKHKGNWKISGISIGDYRGYILETPALVLGHRGSQYVDLGSLSGSVSGVGHVIKGCSSIRVEYRVSVSGDLHGSGAAYASEYKKSWFNPEEWLKAQGATALAEAKAALGSFIIVPGESLPRSLEQEQKPEKPKNTELPTLKLVTSSPVNAKLKIGDVVTVTAVVENVSADDQPLYYEWEGNYIGKGETVQFVATKPGKNEISVTVIGAQSTIGSESAAFDVPEYKLKISGPQSGKVMLGAEALLTAKLLADGKPASGDYSYLFEPVAELQMNQMDTEAGGGTARVKLTKTGAVNVWALAFEKDGEALHTIAESEQLPLNVIAPKFDIVFDPPQGQGKVGDEIKATIKSTPPIDPSLVEFNWMDPPTSNRMEYETNASVIGFKLSDTKPLDLLAIARIPGRLEDIGELKASYSASLRTIKAEVLGPIGPVPKVWKEGVGLVDVVAGTYAADQHVRVKASMEGESSPDNLRWKWMVNEGTTLVSSGISAEITAYRGETGTAECTVEAMDKDGVSLGKAVASFNVTVSSEEMNRASAASSTLTVELTADRTTLKVGERAGVRVKASGGKPPYTYEWAGDREGDGMSVTFIASLAGSRRLYVTVRDASGKVEIRNIEFTVVSEETGKAPSSTTEARATAESGAKATKASGSSGAVETAKPSPGEAGDGKKIITPETGVTATSGSTGASSKASTGAGASAIASGAWYTHPTGAYRFPLSKGWILRGESDAKTDVIGTKEDLPLILCDRAATELGKDDAEILKVVEENLAKKQPDAKVLRIKLGQKAAIAAFSRNAAKQLSDCQIYISYRGKLYVIGVTSRLGAAPDGMPEAVSSMLNLLEMLVMK